MTLDEIIVEASAVGLKDIESIRKFARGAVVLRPSGAGGGERLGSRLGGLPALPPTVPWPQWKGRSLAFIAQIELNSLPMVAFQEGFPREGLLLFFFNAEQPTWGFDPKDAGSFAVAYVPDSATTLIADRPADLTEDAWFPACSLAPEETVALPPWESILIDDLHLDKEQMDVYQRILDRTYAEEFGLLLGGYPDQIQGDMMLECELVSRGLYCGDAKAYQDPRLPLFRKSARDWRLLLQVDSVESAGMMWGDLGCLYYWIREEDLRARRFERSWMILQCH